MRINIVATIRYRRANADGSQQSGTIIDERRSNRCDLKAIRSGAGYSAVSDKAFK